jgi:hypothetical protein
MHSVPYYIVLLEHWTLQLTINDRHLKESTTKRSPYSVRKFLNPSPKSQEVGTTVCCLYTRPTYSPIFVKRRNNNPSLKQSSPCRSALFCLEEDRALSGQRLWPHRMTHPTPATGLLIIKKTWMVGRSASLSLSCFTYGNTATHSSNLHHESSATRKMLVLSWALRGTDTRQQLNR